MPRADSSDEIRRELNELSMSRLLERWPQAEQVLREHGLEAFCTTEAREGIGRFLKLETVLRRKGFAPESFLEERLLPALQPAELPALAAEGDAQADEVFRHGGKPGSVLALLPCGLKRSFHAGFREFAEQFPQENARLDCLLAGNLNFELSYYPHVASLRSPEELPDLLIVADFNSFFHHDFMERFTNRGVFATPDCYPGGEVSPVFAANGYLDPLRQYMMLTANPLVLVADHSVLGSRTAPRSWAELLEGDYKKDVAIRGDGSFFCNGVLLPLYQRYGMAGLKKLAALVKDGLHPSQMVQQLSTRAPGRTGLYIMPYFFAQTITGNPDCEILWPAEGAIISPVFMAARADRLELTEPLIRYLACERFGAILDHAYFPPVPAGASSFDPQTRNLLWLGWDFLRARDSDKLKEEIAEMFVPEFRATF